ncbi:hypothetical protein [Tunturiibacter gelidiferens]|uniref:hypothetical protein n=1 Tax=Tunturiibacter gelidiferens TaxID=3069689 RepID=UPI003D9BFA63
MAIGVGTAEFNAIQVANPGAVNAAIVRMVQQLVRNLQSAYEPGQVQLTIAPGGALQPLSHSDGAACFREEGEHS